MAKQIRFAILALVAFAIPAQAAKYAGEFLSLGVGARPIALGGAYVADMGDVLAGYYNPAGLAALGRPQAAFMHAETFGQLLNHDYIAYARPLGDSGNRAVMALSLYRLGGGGIIVTGRDQTGRFYQVSEESHADYAGYVSYGRRFGERLSAGVSAKLIYRDILDESAFGLGLDIGTHFAPQEWLDFGLNLRDATTTLLSYSTGKKESIYPTAKLGARLHGVRGSFGGALYVDGDFMFEGRDYAAQVSAGPASLDSHVGLEIAFRDRLAARIGSDAGSLTLGAGLRFDRFGIDVAMRDHADLDNTFLASLTANF